LSFVQVRCADYGKVEKLDKYQCITGSKRTLYGRLSGKPALFVTEGEFDALCLLQRVHDRADVATLGDAGAKLPDWYLPALLPIRRFYIATDADASGDGAAEYWQKLVGTAGRRARLPEEYKDCCDAYAAGVNLRAWAFGLMDVDGV
jgi:hypothetical protein